MTLTPEIHFPTNREEPVYMVSEKQIKVYGGIDTHADTHHIAVIDATGQRLADVQVPARAKRKWKSSAASNATSSVSSTPSSSKRRKPRGEHQRLDINQ